MGTKTSRILSCMSMDSILFSRFFLTFSSWPEYAWITYHWASSAGVTTGAFCVAISRSLGGRDVDVVGGQGLEPGVDGPDEGGDDHHGDDHHQGEPVELLGRGPDHFPELVVGLPQETDQPELGLRSRATARLDGHGPTGSPGGTCASCPTCSTS